MTIQQLAQLHEERVMKQVKVFSKFPLQADWQASLCLVMGF